MACSPRGLGVSPSNNIDGVRMSTAMTHLNPVRHHLNLTVRGGVFARKILIKDGKAVGVEAESGGQVFQIEAGRVVLSSGAIRSPHLLMLSGIGPAATICDNLAYRRSVICPVSARTSGTTSAPR